MYYYTRLVSNVIHGFAILSMVGWIRYTKSVAGLSLKTQILNAMVMVVTSYNAWVLGYRSMYPIALYILFGLYLLVLAMFYAYRSTYSLKEDSFNLERLFLVNLLLAIIFTPRPEWMFALFLEPLAIIPQMHLYHTSGKQNRRFFIVYMILLTSYMITKWLDLVLNFYYYHQIQLITCYAQLIVYLLFFKWPTVGNQSSNQEQDKEPVITSEKTPEPIV